MTINVLGTEYTIIENVDLTACFGLCDYSNKTIHITRGLCVSNESDKPIEIENQNLSYVRKKVIRHEVIHAFRYESGIDVYEDEVNEEVNVDWFAIQWHKIQKVFEELGV